MHYAHNLVDNHGYIKNMIYEQYVKSASVDSTQPRIEVSSGVVTEEV